MRAAKSAEMRAGCIFSISPLLEIWGMRRVVAGECESMIPRRHGNLHICATKSRVAYNTTGRSWSISCILNNDKFYAILHRVLYVAYEELIVRVGTRPSAVGARAPLAGIASHLVMGISRPTVSERV